MVTRCFTLCFVHESSPVITEDTVLKTAWLGASAIGMMTSSNIDWVHWESADEKAFLCARSEAGQKRMKRYIINGFIEIDVQYKVMNTTFEIAHIL